MTSPPPLLKEGPSSFESGQEATLIILGLSGGHDANWCVVADGILLGAFEKERFTRLRHDSGEVLSLIGPSLAYLGLQPSDIDVVATSEPVHRNSGPGHTILGGREYQRLDDWQWQTIECLGRVVPCLSIPHHLSHAAYAYYASGMQRSAVITWDGGGDYHNTGAYACTTISSWRGSKLEWIERLENSDFGSLWSVYSRVIFGDRHAAGKLMGLAALGSDRLEAAFADRFLAPVSGRLPGCCTVRDIWDDETINHPPLLEGTARWELPSVQDLAYAIQALTTQAGLSIARSLRSTTALEHLAISGGVGLNGYLNTAIKREAGFRDVFVPPAVHDGGLAVGCALFTAHHALDTPYPAKQAAFDFVGMAYDDEATAQALRKAGLEAARVERDEAEKTIASALASAQIVGWYEGRSEHGPRALGNRSILFSPTDDRIRQRVNGEIKYREPFRPVAPVVLEHNASTYFDITWPSPYMMYIVRAKPIAKKAAPAAVHVDGTSRVQTVDANCSLGRIVSAVGDETGVPIVINTSLNVHAPIVETPYDAIEVFKCVPLSKLYVNGWLLSR